MTATLFPEPSETKAPATLQGKMNGSLSLRWDSLSQAEKAYMVAQEQFRVACLLNPCAAVFREAEELYHQVLKHGHNTAAVCSELGGASAAAGGFSHRSADPEPQDVAAYEADYIAQLGYSESQFETATAAITVAVRNMERALMETSRPAETSLQKALAVLKVSPLP